MACEACQTVVGGSRHNTAYTGRDVVIHDLGELLTMIQKSGYWDLSSCYRYTKSTYRNVLSSTMLPNPETSKASIIYIKLL